MKLIDTRDLVINNRPVIDLPTCFLIQNRERLQAEIAEEPKSIMTILLLDEIGLINHELINRN
jgi:hypothetical protein